MGMARKCDRCGRCFDPTIEEGYMARFRNPTLLTSEDAKKGTREKLLIEGVCLDEWVDLCSGCTKKFMDFMNPGLPNPFPDWKIDLLRNMTNVFKNEN